MDLYRKGLTDGIKATSDIEKHRFVSFSGGYPTAKALSAGLSQFNSNSGEAITVSYAGTALLELNADVGKGNEVTPDSDGKGAVAADGDYVGAIAMEDGAANDIVEVRIVCYKK